MDIGSTATVRENLSDRNHQKMQLIVIKQRNLIHQYKFQVEMNDNSVLTKRYW